MSSPPDLKWFTHRIIDGHVLLITLDRDGEGNWTAFGFLKPLESVDVLETGCSKTSESREQAIRYVIEWGKRIVDAGTDQES